LIDKSLTALGARPEHLALHLRDHQLQVLDQRLGAGELGACFDQRRLERIFVVRKMISRRPHELDCSTIAADSQIKSAS